MSPEPTLTEAVSPLEARLDLQGQYRDLLQALNETGVIGILPHAGELGIVGYDGQEYPLPSYHSLAEVFIREANSLQVKVDQDFTRLQLTPLGLPIAFLEARVADELKRLGQKGPVLATKHHPNDADVPLEVNPDTPTWVWQGWTEAEFSGQLIYYPRGYSEHHAGLTKAELLNWTKSTPFPGWIVTLQEANLFLPREGEAKTIGGRKQLENNHSPQEYLRIMGQDQAYRQEAGIIIESFLTRFLTHLHTTHQVSHGWDDQNALWLLGNYHMASGYVPLGSWDRDFRQLRVNWNRPGVRNHDWGAGAAVRVG